jgi:hypothetical protein
VGVAVGTSSIRRLIYLGILYAAAHVEQADMDEQEAALDALDLMLQLPGAQELSADAVADLVQTCGDLRVGSRQRNKRVEQDVNVLLLDQQTS